MKTKPQTFEEKILYRIEKSKEIVKQKYFRQFCNCQTDIERNEIGSKMAVLDSVIYDVTKALQSGIDN